MNMTPPGCIKIRYVFSNGEFEGEVVEHGVGTSCNTENDKAILSETDAMIGKTENSGLTQEGNRIRKERPMTNIPQTELPFGRKGSFGPSEPSDKPKKLDLGFGA